MMAERGWTKCGGTPRMLPILQIVGLLVIVGLIVALVVMRKRDSVGVSTKTKSSTRI
jgi:hypothetical protein